ncbi:peptidoglycan DD-metalloendopeptidase family protein [Streptomyces sp. CB02009]|uniref:peptidoglycan DD-metalloendopeptidase family protein n=1 Tax=Streptomyces sp. CB02009 TaxID=1703938 RepID=UPI000ABD466F|nr:peptidoglycan DD-metalloendopeptidase family protein [Streptomyces sp. CB02009]
MRFTSHQISIAVIAAASASIFTATTVAAAPLETWDAVAACESSGDWSAVSPSGYRGGLQFSQSTWQEFGGTQYAPTADKATKEQQIIIAEKVLQDQGPGAWPVCSVKAGLAGSIATAPSEEEVPRASSTQTAAPAIVQRAQVPFATYKVQPGDTWNSIAMQLHIDGGAQQLKDSNRALLGDGVDAPPVGVRLSVGAVDIDTAPHAANEKPVTPQVEVEVAPSEEAKATAPLDQTQVTTSYRAPGSMWSSGYHTGVDFAAPNGTPVKAISSGEVIRAGSGGSYGNEVIVRHADGHYSQYAHLSQIAVQEGQEVSGGFQIGLSGSTGNSSGPHLHFEVRTTPDYGSDIDPTAYLGSLGVTI